MNIKYPIKNWVVKNNLNNIIIMQFQKLKELIIQNLQKKTLYTIYAMPLSRNINNFPTRYDTHAFF